MKKTPMYWISLNFSSKKINANIELKIGENESRGIVKLSSELKIALRKRIAEITPITTKTIPGTK